MATLGVLGLLHRRADIQYRTVVIDRGDNAASVSATGNPNAVVTVQVGSQVSGNILALYADFNTKVKKGQVVARIEPQIFQAKVDQARATLNAQQAAVVNAEAQIEKSRADAASAQANVANGKANMVKAQSAVNDAKIKLDRRIVLVQEDATAKEDADNAQATYDQAIALLDAANAEYEADQQNVNAANAEVRVAQTQIDSAQAQVKEARAELAQAQLDLDHTFITAPVDGVVVARNVDVGQTVAASLQAPTLFRIAQGCSSRSDRSVEGGVGHGWAGVAADPECGRRPRGCAAERGSRRLLSVARRCFGRSIAGTSVAEFLRLSRALAELLPAFGLHACVDSCRPTDSAVQYYLQLAREDEGEKLPVPNKPLFPEVRTMAFED
jgi:multidrug efflux pump subunit AcrA (membrane-fusion protein)